MSKARVRALRSIDLGVAALAPMRRFFTEVWNLDAAGAAAGTHYLRATGPFHHVLGLRESAQPAVIRVVFDAADRATVDALHAQVVAIGLATVDPPAPLRPPHGDYGFGFKDPEGRNLAVVCGGIGYADHADRPDRPRKLSHVNLNTGDSEATLACFRDALGFRLSDTTRKLRFLSCNSDHHSVVIGFSGGATLNHIAFEMPDLDSVMRGAGRMRDHGHGLEWGPGRHGPGHNVFCYFLGPQNLPIEYTAEMLQIDDTYRVGTPDDWKWPPGRLDHWGLTAKPSERMEAAGLDWRFSDDGWRLDEWK